MKNYDGLQRAWYFVKGRYRSTERFYLGEPCEDPPALSKPWPQHTNSLNHRIDGPAIIVYKAGGKIIRQEYWIYGHRIAIARLNRRMNKAKDKEACFSRIVNEHYPSKFKYAMAMLLLTYYKALLSKKFRRSVEAAVKLVW